ncbi:MAG: nucleotidyltransferase domain-containing protein [Candidatus Sumerlaeota bacterium]|nr:nucleotidyltransferase domain-containing protein [Candidatus Sumerlaeota bacterium]
MISERDREILKEFTARLREKCPDARVWAFGSRARGDNEGDSDFDICVVLDYYDEQRHRLVSDIAWEIGFDNEVVIGTIHYSREQFECGPISSSPLVRNILREGIAA